MRGVMTVTDTAYYLQSTVDAIHALVGSGSIPFHKQGRRLIFVRSELDDWIRGLPGVSVAQALQPYSVVNTVDTQATVPDHPGPARTGTDRRIPLVRGRERTHLPRTPSQSQKRAGAAEA